MSTKNTITLQLIAPFHTVVSDKYSHCAFTGKVLRFSKMMRLYGYHIIEYSNGESQSQANEHVQILTEDRLNELKRSNDGTDFVGNDAIIHSPLWDEFNGKLITEMKKRVKDGDVICYPFGRTHELTTEFPKCYHIETGIGYPDTFLHFRIFESSAWMHWHYGKDKANAGKNYNWIIPNYYDLDDWEVNAKIDPEESYILYFGRIVHDKGLQAITEIAKRLHRFGDHVPKKVIICGQGDPAPYLEQTPNLEYRAPIHGRERSNLLKNAYCVLMPTIFIEPFGGAGVEAQLCGTPLIASGYGAFPETVVHGFNGYRCTSLGDWLAAIESVKFLDREKIAEYARSKYSLEACGYQYDNVFRLLTDLSGDGWNMEHSYAIDDSPNFSFRQLHEKAE